MSIGLAMTAAAALVAAMGTDAGADGGFAVPPEFRTEIARKLASPLSLASYCNVIETSSNSLSIPTEETTPWQPTGGIQAYWENEAAPIPPTKPLLSQATLRLNKLSCLVPVSDELIEDATALASYLEGKAADKLIAKLNTAIIAGTGAGQPQGILKSTSLITVTKETTPTTQANGTVILPNIVNVWTRVLGSWRKNAVWLVNDDVIPQLDLLDFRKDNAAATTIPVYLPRNSISDQGYDTLKGRPVIPCDASPALGQPGDIILADLQQYLLAVKTHDGAPIKENVSIHLYFDQGLTAFRFVMRVAGAPSWRDTVTLPNSSMPRSWATTLEAR